ncbi:MAG: ABC transporter permease [Heliobacteriaceae bacterium]|nr:ABC transporter permease [Heliobacteriaceae bacterium]
MTLFDLTWRNVKNNFQTYFLYFVSMVFSILVFYLFNSINYNQQVTQAVGNKMNFLLSFGSILTAVFSAIFMGYSHAFFTRRRKREIGLYNLLGLQRSQVAKMLFCENLVMGTIALASGIFLGVLFSKLFTMLLLNLMGHYVQINLFISPRAVFNTVGVFLLVFLIISWHAHRIIYRFQLVELFRAEQRGESQPHGSVRLALLSILLIAGGYLVALNPQLVFLFPVYAVLVLGLVISGTFALFKSFSVFALQLARRNKQHYYWGMNLISNSNLLYRIKSNAAMLATIAVLSAITLTAVGMSYSLYFGAGEEMQKYFPFSYVYLEGNLNEDRQVDAVIAAYPQHGVRADVKIPYLELEGKIFGITGFHRTAQIISESSYLDLIRARGVNPDIKLKNPGEAILFAQGNPSNLQGETFIIKNEHPVTQEFQITEAKPYLLMNTMFFTLVVSDGDFAQMTKVQAPAVVRGILVDRQAKSAELSQELNQKFNLLSSFFDQYRWNLEQSGMTMFVGAFLGLVFLLATGSVIYFRQLNEAGKDHLNYIILRKIGVGRREIRRSISRQVMVIFLFPLLVGTVHAVMALSVLGNLLYKNLTIPIAITVVAYTLIYLFYYLLTVDSYDRLVNAPGQ